jgi:hypothetical protein
MPDPDAAIRAKIERKTVDETWLTLDQFGNALLAVLDLHPADPHECPHWDTNGEQYTAYDPTCPTRLAIAKELGIEVTDA